MIRVAEPKKKMKVAYRRDSDSVAGQSPDIYNVINELVRGVSNRETGLKMEENSEEDEEGKAQKMESLNEKIQKKIGELRT